nr:MAG TPA: portal protein [Caudoviricetes sp.]
MNPNYCRSRDTSAYGTACVEFNVQYFARYQDKTDLEKTLKNFPAGVRSYWNAYHAGKVVSPWARLATESSCAFFMDNKCTPPIYSSIIDIMNFGDYKNIEKKRDSSELEKLLV